MLKLKIKLFKALIIFWAVVFPSALLAQQNPAQQSSEPVAESESPPPIVEPDLIEEENITLEKEKAEKEAERVEQERLKKQQLAKQKSQQKVGEKSKVFIPTEEISEDQPVAFPIDI